MTPAPSSTDSSDSQKRSFLLEAFTEAIDPGGFQIEGYEIIREIDRGGMGIVYLAQQKNPEREVALKVMLPKYSADEKMRERFRREAQAMAVLDHPGILPIYEVGSSGAFPYFSMKLAWGGSLAEKLTHGPLTPAEAAALLENIALALHHAHQRGLLHRDLKPGNFLFDSDGQVFVSDFGVAKIILDSDVNMTQTLSLVGTPHYLPPEIASGSSKATIAADIYSLGAVLYECLSGKKPIAEQETLAGQLRAIIEDPIIPLRQHRSDIPHDLNTICQKALTRDPGGRYSSAASFAADLRRWQDGYTIRARPATPVEIAWRWCKRHRLASGLSLALLLVALASTALILSQELRSRREIRLQLHDSLTSQARAERLLAAPGFRERSLSLLRQASKLKPSTRIDNEALATLAAIDISPRPPSAPIPPEAPWPLPPHPHGTIVRRIDHSENLWSLVFYGNGSAALWEKGQATHTHRWIPIRGSRIAADFSPTSSTILVSGAQEQLLSFSGPNFKKRETLTLSGKADFLSASPTSPLIAYGRGDDLMLYSSAQQEMLWEKANQRIRCTPAWSKDGRHLAVALGDEQRISILDATTGDILLTLETECWPETMAFDSELRFLAVAGDDGIVRIFDLITSETFAQLPAQAIQLGFSADSHTFWAMDPNGKNLHLWNIHTAQGFREWSNQLNPGRKANVHSSTLSPDGKWLLLTDPLGVELWSISSRAQVAAYSTKNQRVDAPTTAWWLPGENSKILLQIPGAWEVLHIGTEGTLTLSHPWEDRPPGVTIRDIFPDGTWLVNELDEDGGKMVREWPSGDYTRSKEPSPQRATPPTPLTARAGSLTAKTLPDQTIQISGGTPPIEQLLTPPRSILIEHIYLIENGKRLLAIGADHRLIEWDLQILQQDLRQALTDPP